MSLRDGDTLWNHHPNETYNGDIGVNNRPGDVWYLVVDETKWETAWDILNEVLQATSWHIHPALIPYIINFVVRDIQKSFKVQKITTNFAVCPIQTSFKVSRVITDSVSLKEVNQDMSFSMKNEIQFNFTLRQPIQTNFKITRVFSDTRTP
jgi:hypothetical protein